MVSRQFPIQIHDLSIRRGGVTLLGPIEARLEASGITMVLGPNGAGKSTFLRVLHGMERINSGTLEAPSIRSALQKKQAFVFQHPTMMRRSVLENLAFPLHLDGVRKAAARAKALAVLEPLGLKGKADLEAHHLSGGERQKLALARALIRQPELLFLDEPCANLDGASTRDIEQMLEQAVAQGTQVIMATHDLGQARRLARQVVFLHKGKLIENAEAHAFFEAPNTSEARAYLRGDLLV